MSQGLPPVVLTIAGADTCAGAGFQADLKTLTACGVYGVTVATILTAQHTGGVHRLFHVPPRFVAAQIDAVAGDFSIAATKTGALGRAQVVRAVAARVRRRGLPKLVVDPVILAKDGTALLCGRGMAALREELLPLALIVTPNVPEAIALSGVQIRDDETLREAAERILRLGVKAVVIKGGHLPGDPVDTLFYEGNEHRLPGTRLGSPDGPPVHGTGCIYSSALAARLALGDELPVACLFAQEFTRAAIEHAIALGRGSLLAWTPRARLT